MKLRGRLMLAFALAVLPALLLLGAAVTLLVTRRLEAGAERRLAAAREAVERELVASRTAAERRLALVAEEDLRRVDAAADPVPLAGRLARARDLPVLEIEDAAGRVVSSAHWPAGFGLPSADRPLGGSREWSRVRAAAGHGFEQRLALIATREAALAGAPVTLHGGIFVDGGSLKRLSDLLGLELALYDAADDRWVAPSGSPLAAWRQAAPALGASRGLVRLSGVGYQWTAAALAPQLRLVVAAPRAELAALRGEVRSAALLLTALALLVALALAGLLSERIARPVRELAVGAERLAAGAVPAPVTVAGRDEVAELAEAFNELAVELRSSRERLVQAERVAAWREVARRLAHELKNPLFPIQVSIETLRRAHERAAAGSVSIAEFDTLFEESTRTLLEELQALRRVIDAFSDFARLPRPALRLDDVNRVVEQAVSLHRARAEGIRLELALDPRLPQARIDPDLLGRAVSNLVRNALEALAGNGTLRVATSAAAGTIRILVADSGPGLTPEQRERLFTPYYTTKPGGTGLGLALAQGIVSDHGGRVEVDSRAGEGARFTIVLPAKTAAPILPST